MACCASGPSYKEIQVGTFKFEQIELKVGGKKVEILNMDGVMCHKGP